MSAEEAASAAEQMSQEELDKEMAKIHAEIDKLRLEHDEVRVRDVRAGMRARTPSICYCGAEPRRARRDLSRTRVHERQVFKKGDKNGDGLLSPEEFYAVQKEDDPEAAQVDMYAPGARGEALCALGARGSANARSRCEKCACTHVPMHTSRSLARFPLSPSLPPSLPRALSLSVPHYLPPVLPPFLPPSLPSSLPPSLSLSLSFSLFLSLSLSLPLFLSLSLAR
jgi:hypothetical protein